jgi:hypothetical protein
VTQSSGKTNASSSNHSSLILQANAEHVALVDDTIASGETSRKTQHITHVEQKRNKTRKSPKRRRIRYTYDDVFRYQAAGEHGPSSAAGKAATSKQATGSHTAPGNSATKGEGNKNEVAEVIVAEAYQVLIACYWAATRCAVWTSSLESEPF